MKRVSKLLVLILLVALTMTGCSLKLKTQDLLGVLKGEDEQYKETDKQSGKDELADKVNSAINKNGEGDSKFKFEFKAPKVKEKAEMVDPAKSIQEVKLYIGGGCYYIVELPADLDVVTDNGKYIYAKDSTVSVAVISGVPWDEFTEYADIKSPESVLPYLVKSQDGKKGPQEAAMHVVDDKAIIVRTYDNPVAFATIIDGLQRNTYKAANFKGMTISEKETELLNSLPAYTGYHVTVNMGLSDDVQNMYNYEDGTLAVAREFKTWEDANDAVGKKMAVIAGGNIADRAYMTDMLSYIEKGDYTVGIISVNYNTSITLFGNGEEARFNIIAFLKGHAA